MNSLAALLLLQLLAVVACAEPSLLRVESDARYVSNKLPSGWKMGQRSPNNQMIELVFAIKQQNVDVLERVLATVSDPRSADYGHHWSNEKIHELVAPRTEDVATVTKYLEEHGLDWRSGSMNNDFIQ